MIYNNCSTISDVQYGRYTLDMENHFKVIGNDEGFTQLTGYTNKEVQQGQVYYDQMLCPEDIDEMYRRIMLQFNERNEAYLEHRLVRKNGEVLFVFCFGAVRAEGKRHYIDVIVANILRDKNQTYYLLKNDSITGLLNPVYTKIEVGDFLEQSDHRAGHALLRVSVDHFQTITETLGYMFGDTVIENVAQNLKQVFDDSALIGRIGRDDFLILAKNISRGQVEQKAEELWNLVCQNYVGTKADINLSCSIGISYAFEDGSCYEDLFLKADAAMNCAGRHPKGGVASYQAGMEKGYVPHKILDYDNHLHTGMYDVDFLIFASSLLSHSKDLDSTINLLFEKMGKYYELDEIALNECCQEDKTMHQTHVWRQGKGILTSGFRVSEYWEWNGFLKLTDERGFAVLEDIATADISEEERETLQNYGVRALTGCTFYESGVLNGYVAFYDRRGPRKWTEREKGTFYEISRLLSVFADLRRERNLDKAQIERLSSRDALTGLYNMDAFKRLAMEKLEARDPNLCYAMIYTDINNFSYVNENFGYGAGDVMLKNFSLMLLKRADKTVSCRVNSDCFLVLSIRESKENVLDMVRGGNEEFMRKEKQLYPASDLSLSTGVYFIEPGEVDIVNAIDNANLARKATKHLRANDMMIYTDSLRIQRNRELSIIGKIHRAIEQGEIEAFLQPRFSLTTREMIGAEALARWRNQDGTMIYPDQFIPILERVGYIVELDFCIYEQVLRRMQKWKQEGRMLIPISINFSRAHAKYDNFVEKVCALADRYQVDHSLIEIEVTENSLMDDFEQVIGRMKQLQKNGFKIDMDDFGTGYSSLNLLLEAPLDLVKVDRSFLQKFNSEMGKAYIRQIGNLICITQKEIVFEGVETEEQAAFLMDCGYTVVQGFLFERPIPMDEFEQKYMNLTIED